MKSLNVLFRTILNEIGDRCCTSTTLDLKKIESRIETEGISFLTITLANYGKDFEKSLDQGFVDRSSFQGFAFKGGLPQLFGGFLGLIFDMSTGRLLDNPSIDAIRGLRQITLMWAKIKVDCTEVRQQKALDGFIQCEQDIKSFDQLFPAHQNAFNRIGAMLYANLFSNIDLAVYNEELLPKHGPGATADKIKGNLKYLQRTWTRRLDEIMPMSRYVFHSYAAFMTASESINILEPGQELPVKVTLVPKSLKTPRIIAIEPTCMQYAQQAIHAKIVEEIAKDDFLVDLIDYSLQTPNQELARIGSLHRELATLDLSEASDRVSNQHVRSLLQNHPHLLEAVDASRSRKADVPGRGVIRLSKFASMGSALCFPFEAIVFSTIIFLGIERKLNRQLTKKDIESYRGRVRVYGDDIIVPVDIVDYVIGALEDFGLKVNTSKSFWNGKFRESCGKEYYDGHDVSIVKVRRIIPASRKHTEEIISTVSLRNQLFLAGYDDTVGYLDSVVERFIPFPSVLETSPVLGKLSYHGYDTERTDKDLQRPLVRGAVVSSSPRSSNLLDEGDACLMKWFLKDGNLPFADQNHLRYAGRPVAVNIKLRWAPPF